MRLLTLSKDSSRMEFRCPYGDLEIVKSIPGRSWNKGQKCWEFPLRPEYIRELAEKFKPIGGLSAEKGLIESIRIITERENAVAAIKKAGWEQAAPDAPVLIKMKPFVPTAQLTFLRHQVLAFNLGIKIPHFAIFAEQGLGKCVITISILGYRWKNNGIKRVIVFCPASVVHVWPNEFADFANYPARCIPLTGEVDKRIITVDKIMKEKDFPRFGVVREFNDEAKLTVLVTNYEASWRMEAVLQQFKPDVVICDESQKVKSPGAEQSKAVYRIGKKAKHRYILTGTPVGNNPLDLYQQYKFLDESILGTSKAALIGRYFYPGRFSSSVIEKQGGSFFRSPQLEQEYLNKVHRIAFRVTKAECLDLPEKIDQVMYCELDDAGKKAYKQLKDGAVLELSSGQVISPANKVAKMVRLSQITGGFMKADGTETMLSKAKINLLESVIDDLLEQGNKVVIFARFSPEIAAIDAMLTKKKIGHVLIQGDVAIGKRGELVKQFQESGSTKCFLAQIKCAESGITLTASDTVIYYSLDYSYLTYAQSKDRIHRIGQRNNCTYIHLLAKGTIDEQVYRTLKDKKDVATDMVDNWEKYVGG